MDSVLIIVTSTYSSNFLSVDKIVRWPFKWNVISMESAFTRQCLTTVYDTDQTLVSSDWKSTILQFHEKKEERLGQFVTALPPLNLMRLKIKIRECRQSRVSGTAEGTVAQQFWNSWRKWHKILYFKRRRNRPTTSLKLSKNSTKITWQRGLVPPSSCHYHTRPQPVVSIILFLKN